MKSKKILAIWMDHSIAYIMEFGDDNFSTITIKSDVLNRNRTQDSIQKNKNMKLPNQNKLSAYYRKISDSIMDHEDVILFGPSGPKNELFNLLLLNPIFDRINMAVKYAAILSDMERESFIRENAVPSGRSLSSFQLKHRSYSSLEPGYYTS